MPGNNARVVDDVQRVMERMIPELEELKDQGIMNEDEIKKLVSRRREYEYLIRRKTVRKEDFDAYIDYEISVDLLIAKRCERLNIKPNQVNHMVKRVSMIYDMAVKRFRGDISVWVEAIEHAKHHRNTTVVENLFLKAVRFHPREAGFWILQAAYEAEDLVNIEAARVTMQRGLRFNSDTSSQMWYEYFRLELLNVFRLMKRRSVLGIHEVSDQQEKDDEEKKPVDVLRAGGKILNIIYANACKTKLDSPSFRCDFLKVLEPFLGNELLHSLVCDISKHIANDVENNFQQDLPLEVLGALEQVKTSPKYQALEKEKKEANIKLDDKVDPEALTKVKKAKAVVKSKKSVETLEDKEVITKTPKTNRAKRNLDVSNSVVVSEKKKSTTKRKKTM